MSAVQEKFVEFQVDKDLNIVAPSNKVEVQHVRCSMKLAL